MQTDQQVVTGEAVALDLTLAGIGSRGIAAMIDLAIMYTALIVALPLTLMLAFRGNPAAFAALWLVVFVAIFIGYPVGMETLWHGRTLGKAVMGLRVVRDDGGPIRFRQALVRGLCGLFLEKPGILFALPAFVSMMISTRNKRVADLLAGTIVLQERVPGTLDTFVYMPDFMAGWAAALDLSGIDDGLALRIRQFISRAQQLTPAARVGLENQLASEVVARVGPPPPNVPAWAILMAVLAERRRRAMIATQPPPPPWLQTQWPPPAGPALPETAVSPPVTDSPPPSTTGYATPG